MNFPSLCSTIISAKSGEISELKIMSVLQTYMEILNMLHRLLNKKELFVQKHNNIKPFISPTGSPFARRVIDNHIWMRPCINPNSINISLLMELRAAPFYQKILLWNFTVKLQRKIFKHYARNQFKISTVMLHNTSISTYFLLTWVFMFPKRYRLR